MNKTKKVLAVLSTAALFGTTPAAVVAPFLATSVAYAATYEAGNPPQISNSQSPQSIGLLKITFDPSQLFPGNALTVRLPADFNLNLGDPSLTTPVTLNSNASKTEFYLNGKDNKGVYVVIPQASNYLYSDSDNNKVNDVDFANEVADVYLTAKNELKFVFKDLSGTSVNVNEDKAYFQIVFNGVTVASGYSGPVNVAIEGLNGPNASTNPFNSGNVTIANIGSGSVATSIDSVKNITDAGGSIDAIRIREDRPGAFQPGQYIKYKLPSGFTWNKGAYLVDNNTGKTVDPADYEITTTDSDRTLVITSHKDTSSGQAAYLVLQGASISVDTSLAKQGDVTVTVSGTASSSVGEVVVARYGDYGVKVSTLDPQNVLAGRKGGDYAEIGKIVIEETAPGSLVEGRTIKLTLSGNAKWVDVPTVDGSLSDLQNLSISGFTVEGTDRSTIKATVTHDSKGAPKAGKIVLKGGTISVAANATEQDVTVTVSGTAGASGDAGVVAHIVSPVTASIEGTAPDIAPGAPGQPLPPILIKENQAEAIDSGSGKFLQLTFFQNVVPNIPAASDIQVVDGDIVLDTSSIVRDVTPDGRWYIQIPVKSSSSKPSTIKISGLKVTTDRTTPYGPLSVGVGGSALVQNAKDANDDFPAYKAVTSVQVANVAIPAPQKLVATFTVGSTTYTVNGQTQTMDVAPYLKNDGRVMLPVRFVANALGVSDDHIVWNGADQSVTIFKGNSIVKMTVGSNTMI
ncbi:MAG: copper amine oxidase N-terminal domain-containing protein, partial [Alicyclobacillaceae bacterium]|nr:copper amine oxidase N-terminal domain-containing protein [Alicyclobacillaceae bacterium]